MKICHITSVHSALDTRIVIKECQSLSQAGNEVSYIVPNEKTQQSYGVNIIGVTSTPKHRIERMLKTTSAVLDAAKKQHADVYHFHDPELIPVGLKLKKLGKKVIYDVHEDVPEQILSKQWIPKPIRMFISKSFETFEKNASKKFDAVVTATPYIEKRFQKYNANTLTIHNYPLLKELKKDQSITPTAVSQSVNASKVVYLGGIYRLRGIVEMINAVEDANSKLATQLVLGGTFVPSVLEQEVKALPGWKHVDYRGFLARNEVKQALSESHAGLVLLHPEPRFIVSLPIKMFEYMSAGLPVIASNFPIWQEIVEDNACGICVDPLNSEEVTKAIIDLLENPKRAKQLGENGRKAIEEKFNWEKESEKLVALYQKL